MRLYLPVLLVLCLIAVVAQNPLISAITWFMLGIYLLFRLWIGRAAADLTTERQLRPRAFHGEEVEVTLTVRNRGLLPIPWLVVEEAVPQEFRGKETPARVIGLGPRGVRQLRYSLQCRQRGFYRIGPALLQLGDPIGLEERTVEPGAPGQLIVYPRIVALERLGLPTRSSLVALPARSPLFEDPTRIVGVREYQPGDSLRRIHWPASAGSGGLMVKQLQPSIARELTICLDLDLRSYEPRGRQHAMELAIVTAASLANHAITVERLPAGLAVEALDPLEDGVRRYHLPPGTGPEHLMAQLEVLARVQPVTGQHFLLLLQEIGVSLPWGSTVVAISGSCDLELAAALDGLRQHGQAVALVLVREDAASLPALDVPVHRVWHDGDLARV